MNSENLIVKVAPPMTMVSFMLLLVTFMFEKNLESLFTIPLYLILFSILCFLFAVLFFMFKSIEGYQTRDNKILDKIIIFLYFLGTFGFIIAIAFMIKAVH
jgi:uncharacterized membrane protein